MSVEIFLIALAIASALAFARHKKLIPSLVRGQRVPQIKESELYTTVVLIASLHFLWWYRSEKLYLFALGHLWFWLLNGAVLAIAMTRGVHRLKQMVWGSLGLSIFLGMWGSFKENCVDKSLSSCPIPQLSPLLSPAEAKVDPQQALSARLRNAKVLPKRDTSFIVVATEYDQRIFLVHPGYCTYVETENPGESLVFTNQNGQFKIVPGVGFVNAGRTAYFSLKSYGGPTTEVRVWVFKRTPQGICITPKREST